MDWHRLFGLILMDFFTDSPFTVEMEKDLAVTQQRLDVVILRRGEGPFSQRLPDGLDDLAPHNLVTFKSHHEPLDDWALKELTGHYVNYRKQVTAWNLQDLPETDCHLYGVCARYPQNLASQVSLQEVRQGVYECWRGSDRFRIVVAGQLPEEPHNAILHLFSASTDKLDYGASHYSQRSHQTNTLVRKLFGKYEGEGILMAYTMEDFRNEVAQEQLRTLPPKERAGLLGAMSSEQLAETLRNLSPQMLRDVLKELPPDELEATLHGHKPKKNETKRRSPERQTTRQGVIGQFGNMKAVNVVSP